MPFLASAITFDATLAAVPFLLLLVIALTHLLPIDPRSVVDIHQLFQGFLPPHVMVGGRDPFAVVERVLAGIARNRGQLSVYAIPTFVWFSTRLFAGIRTSLNHLYDVSARPQRRHFVLAYLLAKVRDVVMVAGTLTLFLLNTAISTSVGLIETRGVAAVPQLAFFLTSVGQVVGELIAFGFAVSLFFVVYRYASIRRLPWRPSLVAATFSAFAFEIAKRLFGLYLGELATSGQFSLDANVGAVLLFILWVWYTAIVFLLGGVVAETWDMRQRKRTQRAELI